MPSINVNGAAARLLATGVLAKAGLCLHYCWLAISQGRVHYLTGGTDTAYNTWLAVPADHQHSSRAVPKDFPAFLGKKFLSSAGDVIISNGDGTFTATDWPKSKQVGICTLAQREKQTGRKFVGWASSMGGYELESTSTAGESGTPITEQDDDMSQIQYYERTGTPDPEWMIAGEEIPGGYEVTLDKNLARIWGRQYSGEGTAPVHVDRTTYIAAQAYWKARAAAWEARQVKRITDALAKIPASGSVGIVELGPKSLGLIRDAIPKTFTAE